MPFWLGLLHLACPPVHVVTHGRMSFCSPPSQPHSLNSLVPRRSPSLGPCCLLLSPARTHSQGCPPCLLCQEPILVCDSGTCCASVGTSRIRSLSGPRLTATLPGLPLPASGRLCSVLSAAAGGRHLVPSPQWPRLFLGPANPPPAQDPRSYWSMPRCPPDGARGGHAPHVSLGPLLTWLGRRGQSCSSGAGHKIQLTLLEGHCEGSDVRQEE